MTETPGEQQPPQYTPPPGYQPPPQGYQQPPQGWTGGPPPAGPMRPDEERTWALMSHIGTIVLGFIAPLVVMLVKGNESPMVRHHSVESLNFQITLFIVYAVSIPLMLVGIGVLTFFAAWILALVFAIIATIAANKGEPYRYPLSIRLVK